jgi:hypothetical protein
MNAIGRNVLLHHGRLDDLAFGKLRSRRDTAADDRPAEQPLASRFYGRLDTARDVLAGAEHEQQIG